jgi:predicted XRE-type DNA-binding protein
MATEKGYNLRGIPESTWKRLKVAAAQADMTIKDAIIEAITEWLEKRGK